MKPAKPRSDRRFKNVPRVLQAIYVANLVAIKCRDGELNDPQSFQRELNDDLGVEMEIIRVSFKRNLSERLR